MPQPGSGFPRVCFVGFEDVFPSLCRQNGKKKLPSFFGMDGGQERDTTTDKILQYIPAKASANTSSPLPAAPGVYSHPPRAEHSGGTSGLGLGVAAALSQGDGAQEGMSPSQQLSSLPRVPVQVWRGPGSGRSCDGVGGDAGSRSGDVGTSPPHLCSRFFCFWVACEGRENPSELWQVG